MAALLTISLASCRGYEREQDRLDRESEGKGTLLKAESTKKVKIEQAKADLEAAKLNAQTQVIKAEASAQSRILTAKSQAEARIIQAESEAKANNLLNSSITPQITEYLKINKWNGQLPTTVTGANAGTLINVR